MISHSILPGSAMAMETVVRPVALNGDIGLAIAALVLDLDQVDSCHSNGRVFLMDVELDCMNSYEQVCWLCL